MNIAALISVFGLAFLYFVGAIPAGLAQGLDPVVVVVTAAISYACGVGISVLVGQPVRDWVMRRFGRKTADNPNSLLRRMWDRYGMIGLAILAPVTVGSQIGTIIGISLNAPPRRLFVLMSLGGLLWAILFTVAIKLGVAAVQG
jgi:hypothetical protein